MKDRVSSSEAFIHPVELTSATVSNRREEWLDLRKDINDHQSITLLLGLLVGISLMILMGKYPNLVKVAYQAFGHWKKDCRCRSCVFFDQNLYIKCAVHPDTVLTKEALLCPDYWPIRNKPAV